MAAAVPAGKGSHSVHNDGLNRRLRRSLGRAHTSAGTSGGPVPVFPDEVMRAAAMLAGVAGSRGLEEKKAPPRQSVGRAIASLKPLLPSPVASIQNGRTAVTPGTDPLSSTGEPAPATQTSESSVPPNPQPPTNPAPTRSASQAAARSAAEPSTESSSSEAPPVAPTPSEKSCCTCKIVALAIIAFVALIFAGYAATTAKNIFPSPDFFGGVMGAWCVTGGSGAIALTTMFFLWREYRALQAKPD